MNTELILRKLAEIRNAIPQLPQPRVERPLDPSDDFEMRAVADALEAINDDLTAALDDAEATLRAQCLEVYYAAEELARDPANADLVPHVEEMRRAYERSYGTPIPARRAPQ